MNGKKHDIHINNKMIIKENEHNNKGENYIKIQDKKVNKPNKEIFKELKFINTKINFFENIKIKNNYKNRIKKRQNKFKKKENEQSNSNIYKKIYSNNYSTSKILQQSFSINVHSNNSHIYNKNNKLTALKKIVSLKKYDNFDSFKRNTIDSFISRNIYKNNNKKNLYVNKGETERIKNKIEYNKSNNNLNIKIREFIRNKNIPKIKSRLLNNPINIENISNKIYHISNSDNKIEIKKKNIKNKYIKENKNKFNRIFKKNIKKYKICTNENSIIKKNIFVDRVRDIKTEKKRNVSNNRNLNFYNSQKNKNFNNNNFEDLFYINIEEKRNNIKNEKKDIPFFKVNNIDELNKKNNNEIEIYEKKNINSVKKSLFTEYMNFLLTKQNQKIDSGNNNSINNKFKNLFDSSNKKDYESKFINYDLGKTTGSSFSKDSIFHFTNGNDEGKKNLIIKIFNLSKNHMI